MMRKIVKTINTIEEFDRDLYEELNIGVEIQDFTEPNLTKAEKDKIIAGYKEQLKGFKAIKSLHGPFLDLKPASPDLEIRRVSYKRYLETMDIGAELGVDYIIFHSQINPYLKEPFLRNLNNIQAKEVWDKLLAETKYRGTILIENIFEEEPIMLREYIETLDNPRIRINLDIGHASLGRVGLEDWISQLKDHILYIHIHSNDGIYDQHRRPANETIENLYHILDKYSKEPILSLEYKVGDLKEEINRYL